MKPIKYNDKGPAVEDIQRRLRVLGYKIGPEGTSGVFLDDTLAAVNAFQRARGIEPTGAVGPRTWSTLVDSTFELGDRMLYLRMPYFHGADVVQLQHALNSLGFAVGGADGIFGTSTERAVTEFQQNYDINPDGLVGNNTLRALSNLRHIWGSKGGRAHSSVEGTPPRHYHALLDYYFDFQANGACVDAATSAVLRRLVRYANNLEDAARADLVQGDVTTPNITILVRVTAFDDSSGSSDSSGISDGSEDNGGCKNLDLDNRAECALADVASASFVYQNNFKSFAPTLKRISPELQNLKAHDRQNLQLGLPAYEIHIVMPLSLLEAGSESSLPVGLQLMASRLLDALCLAAIA